MSGGGKTGTALEDRNSVNRVVMEIEDNSLLYSILAELKKISEQLQIITGDFTDDY